MGGASPEGGIKLNKRLSEKRAAHIVDFLKKQVSLDGLDVTVETPGVDWAGLRRLVEASDMPAREEVLDIIANVPEKVMRNGALIDGRKHRLMNLRGGRPWKYMYDKMFPELRGSSVQIVCEVERREPQRVIIPEPVTAPPSLRDTVTICRTDTVIICKTDTVYLPAPVEKKPFYMDVRTNMLYDAVLVPNIGVEFYLGKDWSIVGDWAYAWWNSNKRHRYWRIYGGELELRKWFGRLAKEKPLQGHHVGLYGQVATYDFEFGGKGQMGGEPGGNIWDRASWGVGVDYGFSLPVGRHINIDFTLGIGYFGGTYYEYIPDQGCYVWQATKQRHYFGPTKLEVSLVWLLGRGNYNKSKEEK